MRALNNFCVCLFFFILKTNSFGLREEKLTGSCDNWTKRKDWLARWRRDGDKHESQIRFEASAKSDFYFLFSIWNDILMCVCVFEAVDWTYERCAIDREGWERWSNKDRRREHLRRHEIDGRDETNRWRWSTNQIGHWLLTASIVGLTLCVCVYVFLINTFVCLLKH